MKTNYILIALFLLATVRLQAQDTLAMWTFPTGTGSDSLPDQSVPMNSAFTIRGNGGITPINFGTNGNPTFSAQATGWDNGNGTKYWSVRFKTTGYHTISLSSEQRAGSTNPGPRDFKAQYRILPATTWTDIANSAVVCNNAWTLGVLQNLPLPVDLNNQQNEIELRWILSSDTSISGTITQTGGVSKIDNILIRGFAVTPGISNIQNTITAIFPNPADGIVSIETRPSQQYTEVSLFTVAGEKVAEFGIQPGTTTVQADLSYLPQGLYIIKTSAIEIHKLIIK